MIKNIEIISVILFGLNFFILYHFTITWDVQKAYMTVHRKSYFNIGRKELLSAFFMLLILSSLINLISLKNFLVLSILLFWINKLIHSKSMPKGSKRTAQHIFYLYKFLIQQITAGVRPQDALSNMYVIIEDQNTQEVLKKFSAAYQSTYDFSNSKKIIEQYFQHDDAVHFGNIVDEGVKTGDILMALKRQEKLIFNKYMGYIEESSYIMRFKLAVLIIINCFIMVLWIGLPIFLDFIEATQSMFF